ncbi:MAG: CheB methylesterase domain-containing protein [Defluviitaleaceae bacterium]|nr:CheB methylesterase domain-containing protein [Defluviitaleaceae bacterium]
MRKINLIAIGASFGGIEVLREVLAPMPPTMPPIVVVMHLQPGIAKLYATRLDKTLNISAKEAVSGDVLSNGQMLIAPAGLHMRVVNRSGRLSVECFSGEKVEFVRPSADVLFESVAAELGSNALGVILTGIGRDGAQGLLKMRNAGAFTIGQNEKTCTVYGMPKVAKQIGAVDIELTPEEIAAKIISLV